MDSYEILKAFEENGKRLEVYKKKNNKMFAKIDKMFKRFFKG